MATKHRTGKDELQSIAHQAMLQRGLMPDFSPAVIAETNQITPVSPAASKAESSADLRASMSATASAWNLSTPMSHAALSTLQQCARNHEGD